MQSDSDSERVRGCFDVIADYVFKVSPLRRSSDCRIAHVFAGVGLQTEAALVRYHQTLLEGLFQNG